MTEKRPRLLDLFCGAGGAAVGYHRAGFRVVGVDLKPQPHYPFEFHQADALAFPLAGYDVIHASPPCQAYSLSSLYHRQQGKAYPALLPVIRGRLIESQTPWVIENVMGAPMQAAIILCGSMFGLAVQRHRQFESPWLSGMAPFACRHDYIPFTVCGNGTPSWQRKRTGRNQSVAECRAAMGIEWMTRAELSQAIPPAYTEWLGRQLLAALAAGEREVARC